MKCEETGCSDDAAVELDVPWAENRVVCPGHARTWAQKDGVVATPLDGHGDEWP